MDMSEYLLTPKGAYSRFLYKRLKRNVKLNFNGEPLTKKSMKPQRKKQFQLDIIKQLRGQKKIGFSPSTPLCVDMEVCTNAQNPPHIHKIPKNYLDLLSKPLDNNIKRKKIIFEDDRQVNCLNIRYHIGSECGAGISINIYPFNLLIEDIRLANAFLNGELEYEDSLFISRLEDEEEKYNDKLNDSINEYNNLVANKQLYGEHYEIMRVFYLQSVQENFLKTQSISVKHLYWLFCSGISYRQSITGKSYNSVNFIDEYLKELSLNSPFYIKMPSVPTQDDQSKLFEKAIIDIMNEYKSKHKFLTPMLVPVYIKVFYKAPYTTINFNKDLDNIMRIIVPKFHDIFEPPVSILQAINVDSISDDIREKYEKLLSKIPKSIKSQISGYEIFEIPRVEGDKTDGFLHIALCKQYSISTYELTYDVINSSYETIND